MAVEEDEEVASAADLKRQRPGHAGVPVIAQTYQCFSAASPVCVSPFCAVLGLCSACSFLAPSPAVGAQQQAQRVVQGKVVDKAGTPVSRAPLSI